MHTKVKLLGGCKYRHYSNYWGGHSQIIGGIYIPIPPLRGFDTHVGEKMKQRQTNVEETDLSKTIIRVEAQHKAWRHTLLVRSKPIVLVLAQG